MPYANYDNLNGTIYIKKIIMESKSIASNIKIVEFSDLHLWKESMIGIHNVLLISKVIIKENPDIILISGDIVNDAKDLRNPKFCNHLKEVINFISLGKLVIIEKGNHDISGLNNKSWFHENDKLLNDALKSLPNVIFLDEITNLFLKDNKKLQTCGFSELLKSNINFIGINLPWSFYYEEKENYQSFLNCWNNKFANKKDLIFPKNSFTIFDMHAIGNFIKYNKELNYIPKNFIALSGHQHGGLIPSSIDFIIPGHRGIIAPTMQIIPDYQRGIHLLGKNQIAVIGNATNVRVEAPIINNMKCYAPEIRIICLNNVKENDNFKIEKEKIKVLDLK